MLYSSYHNSQNINIPKCKRNNSEITTKTDTQLNKWKWMHDEKHHKLQKRIRFLCYQWSCTKSLKDRLDYKHKTSTELKNRIICRKPSIEIKWNHKRKLSAQKKRGEGAEKEDRRNKDERERNPEQNHWFKQNQTANLLRLGRSWNVCSKHTIQHCTRDLSQCNTTR